MFRADKFFGLYARHERLYVAALRINCRSLLLRFSSFLWTAMPKTIWLSVKQCSPLFPTNPSADTIRRWMTEGVRIPGGNELNLKPIILKSTTVGGRIFTTAAWIKQFHDACQRPIKAGKTNKRSSAKAK